MAEYNYTKENREVLNNAQKKLNELTKTLKNRKNARKQALKKQEANLSRATNERAIRNEIYNLNQKFLNLTKQASQEINRLPFYKTVGRKGTLKKQRQQQLETNWRKSPNGQRHSQLHTNLYKIPSIEKQRKEKLKVIKDELDQLELSYNMKNKYGSELYYHTLHKFNQNIRKAREALSTKQRELNLKYRKSYIDRFAKFGYVYVPEVMNEGTGPQGQQGKYEPPHPEYFLFDLKREKVNESTPIPNGYERQTQTRVHEGQMGNQYKTTTSTNYYIQRKLPDGYPPGRIYRDQWDAALAQLEAL